MHQPGVTLFTVRRSFYPSFGCKVESLLSASTSYITLDCYISSKK